MTPAKGRQQRDLGCETLVSRRPKRREMESQEVEGDSITKGKRRTVSAPTSAALASVAQAGLEEAALQAGLHAGLQRAAQPSALRLPGLPSKQQELRLVLNEDGELVPALPMVEAEAAAAAQEVAAKAPRRAAYRREGGARFKERCFGKDGARCGRMKTSDSRRKEQRLELLQKKRLDSVGFPLLELPEEMQLLVAAHVVSSPRDRAALCVAIPPLGRKASKQIPAYTGPLMSLGKRVLSSELHLHTAHIPPHLCLADRAAAQHALAAHCAVSEAEVRRYVRKFAPSEAAHPSLALNEYAQLNAIAAPSARVRCVTEGSNLEWRLESGALLRSWKPLEGMTNLRRNRAAPGMHHYVGAAGAERLVSLVFADGDVLDFRGERGAEVLWQRRSSGGFYKNIDIPGWWGRGLWHPNTYSSAWDLMMATLPYATCTHCLIDPLRDDPLRSIYLPGHPFLHPTYLLRIHHHHTFIVNGCPVV